MSARPDTPRRASSSRKRGRTSATGPVPDDLVTTPTTTIVSTRPTRERIATPIAAAAARSTRDKENGTPTAPSSARPTRDAVAGPAIPQSEPPPKKRRYIPGGAGALPLLLRQPLRRMRDTSPAKSVGGRIPVVAVNSSSTPLREVNPESTGNTPKPAAEGQATPAVETPQKRRPTRPTRDSVSYFARSDSALVATPKVPQVLPIRNQTAKERLDLKAPAYRRSDRVRKFESNQSRYVDKSMMNVGYQESDQFLRPDHRLLKATDANVEEDDANALDENGEPLPVMTTSAPLGRVEYDMDEQDDMWLKSYNIERKSNELEPITREIFEIALTKIEKEWHALEKRIPKPNPKPPQTHRPRSSSAAAVNGEPQVGEEQDSKCAICDDGDCENTNAIVFCDGCDLAVHQECYGVPFIPEGQWLCRKCQLIGRGIPTCIFCPNTDGAFKQTNSSKWAHLLCAMWIPEVSLGNHTFMEPVMDVDKVPKTRWKLSCYICNQKMGACIQCSNKNCYQAFHVTCARRCRLFLKMKNSQGALAVLDNSMVLKAFCDKHCPPDYTQENGVAQATKDAKKFYKKTMKGRIWADSQAAAQSLAATHRHALTEHPPDESQMTGAKLSNLMGADKKKGQPGKPMWKLPSGAPVIPQAVFEIVEMSLSRFTLRKRKEFVAEACRYWTLKREARRGAALLKRLQLQMETFSSMELTRRNFAAMGPSGKPRLERRIQFAQTLISDLEQLKSLSDALVQREQQKLEAAELERDFVDTCYFPVARLFSPVIEKALMLDKGVFSEGLLNMQSNLEVRFYTTTLAFAHDLCEVINVGINSDLQKDDTADEEVSTLGRLSYDDPRNRRALGKRILKAVQSQLETALKTEAEVAHKPFDTLTKEFEGMLEASLEFRQLSASINVSGTEAVVEVEADLDVQMTDVADGEITVAAEVDDKAAVAEEADEMEVDAEGEMDEDNIEVATSDIKADPESSSSSVAGHEGNGKAAEKPEAPASSDTPPATNGYQAAPPPPQPAPPTPPQSIGSLAHQQSAADPLSEGGVAWHLKDFKLRGTTILADQWPGRDAIRSLSEELSDMDDRELEGLGFDVDDSTITASPNGAAAEPIADTIVSKARATSKVRKKTRSSARRR
ncbi:peregrin [Plectosphaerella plurivora]|uniref:Peregrin n=1 Tax=Plectosphaerella plurivora TaxID=936078 RepID=A0A9P9AF32_9PEZI|nr:peregrin [Plectosphaerella plurivora]